MSMDRHRSRQRGFTWIEQLMVVAIVAVLASIAMPSLAHLFSRTSVRAAQEDLIGAMQHARALAASSGRRVLLCPSRDLQRCDESIRWDEGWLVAIDADHDGQPDIAPDLVGQPLQQIIATSSEGRKRIAFQPDGSAFGSNVTVTLCQPGDPTSALGVVISVSGRVRGSRMAGSHAATCVIQ